MGRAINTAPRPHTGTPPALSVRLSAPAAHTLRQLATAAGLTTADLLRELLRAEEGRRYSRARPATLPYAPFPTPPTPPTTAPRSHSYRLRADDLDRCTRLLRHCLTHEGIALTRAALLTRLIHEEYRRTMSTTG